MGICASILWGIVSCFVGDLATCCAGLLPRDFLVKLLYLVVVILVVAPAIALFYVVQQWTWFIDNFSKYIYCPATNESILNNSA
jgi:hypothetical protein